MNQSIALFLLVGKELVKAQNQPDYDWKYTQNWIAYEIGLACASDIDVWVICDEININFPVPYLNNYAVHGISLETEIQRSWIYRILKDYKMKRKFVIHKRYYVKCPHCGSVFNFYSLLEKGSNVPCPTCLKTMTFRKGWLLKE